MNAKRLVASLSAALLLTGALGLPADVAAHQESRHEYRKEMRHHSGRHQRKHRGHHHGHGHSRGYGYGGPAQVITHYVVPRAAVRDHGRRDRIGVDITYRSSW